MHCRNSYCDRPVMLGTLDLAYPPERIKITETSRPQSYQFLLYRGEPEAPLSNLVTDGALHNKQQHWSLQVFVANCFLEQSI